MPTTTLCHWRPLVSAIAGYFINLRACKKSAHNIEISRSSTATKFWAPKIWSCDNPPQQWMPTTTLCHWRPLDSAIAGYYINLRACKKIAYNIEISRSSTATKFWAPKIRSSYPRLPVCGCIDRLTSAPIGSEIALWIHQTVPITTVWCDLDGAGAPLPTAPLLILSAAPLSSLRRIVVGMSGVGDIKTYHNSLIL